MLEHTFPLKNRTDRPILPTDDEAVAPLNGGATRSGSLGEPCEVNAHLGRF